MANSIDLPFWVLGRMGTRNDVLDRIQIPHSKGLIFGKWAGYISVVLQCIETSGSAMAEGPRDALSVEILQLQNIPFEN